MGFAPFAVFFIQVLVSIWDFFTITIYFLLQRPWNAQKKKGHQRAKIISQQENEVTFRAVPIQCRIREDLKKLPVPIWTMDRLFNYCVTKHGSGACLGSRQVLGEEEQLQTNGKVFTKLQLGEYKWSSYTEIETRADQLGKGLRELGLQPRDKVVLYANTCAEWMVTSIACFKHSLAIVTIYTNLGEEGVIHGLTQTDAGVVVASQELVPRLVNCLPSAPAVHSVVVIPSHKPSSKPTLAKVKFYSIDDLLLMGSSCTAGVSPPAPEDTAIIMYTSGSTGVPKGVVLTHANMVQALYSILPTISSAIGPPVPRDAYVAYLPLAHVLELLGEHLMLLLGVRIGYATTNTLLDTGSMVANGSKGDITVMKPTIMCAVPLVLDRIFKGLQAGVERKGEFTSLLVDYCYKYRLTWTRRGYRTPIMDRLVFKSLRQIVGGELRVLLSGGAPLAPAAHDYCRTVLGITLLQGYGLTETAATASIPDAFDLSTGRVGPPLQEVDIKLVNWEEGGYTVKDKQGPRGEIIVGGGHVAKEYFLMPEKTEEEFFEEGGKRWFKTGDIGELSGDGTMRIIDRKKDLVKLQGGEYVSLGKVESLLKTHPVVENLCVYGDPAKFNTVALVVPDLGQLKALADKIGKEGMSVEQLCLDGSVIAEVLKVLTRHGLSQKLAKFEIPTCLCLVRDPWTPESGLVTAALKLKRKSIETAFKDEIKAMYGEDKSKTK